jgi:YD repeat-containing protein
MTARRLRAPATDGGLLIDPPRDEALGLAARNAERVSAWDYDVQGRRISRLRPQARREVIAQAREFLRRHGLGEIPGSLPSSGAQEDPVPLIVTGHQPELFHPGVWVKNFAVAAIARACGGLALNLIVDNDIPKAASIRVPAVRDGRLRTLAVDFDRWQGEIPYEDWKVGDESLFASFSDRVREVLGDAVVDPLIDDFWPRAIRRRGEASTVGLRFSLARREVEAAWGVSNLELPLGLLCQTDSFLWFASHLIAQLPRYQAVHNACLAEYRAAHHIRSRHHPVAALARVDDWFEAPFWVWRGGQPRRRALLARQRAKTVELRIAGEDEVLVSLPLHREGEACCAVERLRDLAAGSIRIRTRALTTTMFARLFLGDLFIHGIGGAKYDELGDEISRRFLGFEPPGFLALSLTLRLGLPAEPATPDHLAAVGREIRDLSFNPDRHLDEPNPEELRNLINGKRAAIAGPVSTRRQRVARATAIRRLNDAMQPWVSAMRADLVSRRQAIRASLRSNRIAGSREFASVLHSEQRLRHVFSGLGSGWAPGSDGRMTGSSG